MDILFKLFFFLWELTAAENQERTGHSFSGLSATNDPLKELVIGAFLNSWPVTNKLELQQQKAQSLKDINSEDTDDCAKKLLCQLATKKDLTWDEELLISYYDQPVNYMSDSLFLNIAVKVGKDGERQCSQVYPSCFLDLPEMLKIIRRKGILFEIPGKEQDCQVYFLWKKKDKRVESARKTLITEKNETVIWPVKDDEEEEPAMKKELSVESANRKLEELPRTETEKDALTFVDNPMEKKSTSNKPEDILSYEANTAAVALTFENDKESAEQQTKNDEMVESEEPRTNERKSSVRTVKFKNEEKSTKDITKNYTMVQSNKKKPNNLLTTVTEKAATANESETKPTEIVENQYEDILTIETVTKQIKSEAEKPKQNLRRWLIMPRKNILTNENETAAPLIKVQDVEESTENMKRWLIMPRTNLLTNKNETAAPLIKFQDVEESTEYLKLKNEISDSAKVNYITEKLNENETEVRVNKPKDVELLTEYAVSSKFRKGALGGVIGGIVGGFLQYYLGL